VQREQVPNSAEQELLDRRRYQPSLSVASLCPSLIIFGQHPGDVAHHRQV
jgi:hypothetical protein